MNNTYEEVKKKLKRIADINNSAAVLQWDQETFIPKNGNHFRAEQLATLSALSHELFTEPQLEQDLLELSSDKNLNEGQKINIELVLEEIKKQKKYPVEFVELLSHSISTAFQA